jgi:hypothetical protein
MFLVISGILLLVLVVLKKSPAVRWCCFYILTVTLPISFIRQRGGSALYLPLFGWALLAGIVLVKLVDILSSALRWPRFKIPAASVRPALLIFLAYGIVSMTLYSWKGKGTGQILSQEPTWSVMSQLRSFPFRPRPGSSVLFLDDPFTDWRMYFIAQLVWDDHSVNIQIARRLPSSPTQAEISQYNALLAFKDGQPILVAAKSDDDRLDQ